eukprot:gene5065-6168_t
MDCASPNAELRNKALTAVGEDFCKLCQNIAQRGT